MKSVFSIIRSFRLLALLAVALGVSQAQTVSTSGCLPVPTDDDNPCAVSYSITITTNGASIDTYALAGGDDIDASFDVEIDLSVSGPGVADAASDDQEVDLEDNLPPNAAGIYSATANLEACEGYTGEAVRVNEEGGGGCYGGSYSVRMLATIPSVASVSPNSITIGSSGTLTLTGNNFIDTFGDSPTPVSNSGVTLNLTSVSSSQATVSYSANSTAAGQFTIGLIGLFGEGTQQALTVVDPTPTISSIAPNTWNAGTTTSITISGQGFGTAPSLSITGPGVTGYSISSSSNTQIYATVTVAANSPGGSATIQVQSTGYAGSGFLGSSGQSPTTLNYATIFPLPAPPPQIVFLGQNVAQTTQTVYIGQQIALTVPANNLPAGLSVQSQAWTAIPGTAVGGFTVSTTNCGSIPQNNPDDVCPSLLPLPSLTGPGIAFYWTSTQNAEQVTYTERYTWTLSNGQSNSANVTFLVMGPTDAAIDTTPGIVNIWPLGVGHGGDESYPWLELGNGLDDTKPSSNIGMTFDAASTAADGNDGSYSFVQILTQDTITRSGSGGITTLTSVGLDSGWPYDDNTDSTNDSPGANLTPTHGEVTENFAATMYLMWTPTAAAGCSSDACSIPVPLASVNWRFTGDAINTLNPNEGVAGWVVGCVQSRNLADPSQATSSYPSWTVTVH